MKKKDINIEILNACKKQSREEEIKKYGKLISFRTTIIENKKKYNRKKIDKRLNFED